MGALKTALQIIQILLSVALVALIILQSKGSGIGNLLGGGEGGLGITKTRRGLEKTLFQLTIIISAVFLINAVVQLAAQ
ncbi:MAG: preprotein translocase subunit SecG [Anaerolineae bacterium]|nr:preprotein translocase subunit SecG [Anaerolineae bacterium]MDW8298948.1 preprotein translocase subunit SecG [Anaerolineae bacterium]